MKKVKLTITPRSKGAMKGNAKCESPDKPEENKSSKKSENKNKE